MNFPGMQQQFATGMPNMMQPNQYMTGMPGGMGMGGMPGMMPQQPNMFATNMNPGMGMGGFGMGGGMAAPGGGFGGMN